MSGSPDDKHQGGTASGWLRARTVLDRLVALVAGVVSAPVVAVLAYLIKRHDGGPGLIGVERTGRGGHSFKMWKLRSMRTTSADGTAGGPALTLGEQDDRITPIGAKIRSYHLDELPQLWNVVAGEMTLLGPRPEAREFVELGDPAWQEVLSVPPGIAGPTQVIVSDWERHVLASNESASVYETRVLPTKLAIDRWYVKNASPATDALVAATLLRRLLPGTESWTLRQRVFKEVLEAAPAHAFARAQEAARQLVRTPTPNPLPERGPDNRSKRRTISDRVAQLLDARVAQHSRSLELTQMVPAPHPCAFTAELEGEVHGFAGDGTLRRLDTDQAEVFGRCDGRSTLIEIADALAEGNDEETHVALQDLAVIVLRLIRQGFLIDASNSSPAIQAVSARTNGDSGATPAAAAGHLVADPLRTGGARAVSVASDAGIGDLDDSSVASTETGTNGHKLLTPAFEMFGVSFVVQAARVCTLEALNKSLGGFKTASDPEHSYVLRVSNGSAQCMTLERDGGCEVARWPSQADPSLLLPALVADVATLAGAVVTRGPTSKTQLG